MFTSFKLKVSTGDVISQTSLFGCMRSLSPLLCENKCVSISSPTTHKAYFRENMIRSIKKSIFKRIFLAGINHPSE